jgi:hypothetical protein
MLARRARAVALLGAVSALVCAAPAVARTARPTTRAPQLATAAAASSAGLLNFMVRAYAGPLGPFRNGIWQTPDTVCWACDQGGPATAAATAYVLSGRSQPTLLGEAEQTIDTAIATRQRPDGAFVGPPGDGQSGSPDITTMFFGVEMGNTYLELAPVLDPARRARWQASLAAAAEYLIHNGNLNWYTNGNINLGNAELFYLVWKATGNPVFDAAFEQAWSFALNPTRPQWSGYGLVIVKAPQRGDGSDGAGYLTESGGGGTGFDTEYTELQLDVVSRLYLLSGDPRVLRVANLLVNVLQPRIRPGWMLNTSEGTRHTEPTREVPLITSAFAVLGLHGGRKDLVRFIAPQFAALEATYGQSWNDYGAVYRRALGNDVSVIALATHSAPAPARAAATPHQHRRRRRRHRRAPARPRPRGILRRAVRLS